MGYRQHSFDPDAYEQPGRPLKPYNWVQWTGVAIGVLGLVLTTVNVLGQLGWIRPWFDGSQPFFTLLIIGVVLVNSRSEPGTLITAEQRAKNKRVLIITATICAIILGAAAIIELSGA